MTAGEVEVRRLAPGDHTLLASAEPGVFDGPIVAEEARRFLDAPGHHIVAAVEGGRIVGFASAVVCLHPDKPPALFVMELGVAERLRRRGIGRKLLDAILAAGTDAGCSEAWIAAEAGNRPARALYRSAGGVEDATPAIVFTFRAAPAGAAGLR
jgi:aminoglycoside 6'-N-acetyltransferase I